MSTKASAPSMKLNACCKHRCDVPRALSADRACATMDTFVNSRSGASLMLRMKSRMRRLCLPKHV
eukprot:2104474-Pleurochrysis_carterae.AAC.2